MKTMLLGAAVCLSVLAAAQTTHHVTLTAMAFTPNTLTIDVGDSVVFTNSSGVDHNVNGTQATFPSNPESFGNSNSTSWVYGFKFNTAGTYSYQCDVHPTMTGTITVVNGLGLDEKQNLDFSVFPNPANSMLYVKTDAASITQAANISIALFDITGKEVMRIANVTNETTSLPVDQLVNGLYFCSVYDGEKLLATEKVVRY